MFMHLCAVLCPCVLCVSRVCFRVKAHTDFRGERLREVFLPLRPVRVVAVRRRRGRVDVDETHFAALRRLEELRDATQIVHLCVDVQNGGADDGGKWRRT